MAASLPPTVDSMEHSLPYLIRIPEYRGFTSEWTLNRQSRSSA